MEKIVVSQDAGGRWSWRYQQDAFVAYSNNSYASLEDAQQAAAHAYPDVNLVEVVSASDQGGGDG